MPKLRIGNDIVRKIIKLRETGHSLPEIRHITGIGNSTAFKYIKNVRVLPQYESLLRAKQGGSIARSKRKWAEASKEARRLVECITERERLLILACLYWGEGNKRDLDLNNSDPALIKVFVECLKIIGVKKDDLRITLRLYNDLNRQRAIKYWSDLLEISADKILGVNTLYGKKKGKLKYGMCRVRVAKGGPYFKLIMSMIDLIKSDFNAAVVQWIEQRSPNAQM